MCRSKWKVPFVSKIFLSKKFVKASSINTQDRKSMISKLFVGKTIRIYNGAVFKTITVKPLMVGKRLGDFSITKVLGRDIIASKALKMKKAKKRKK